MPAAFVHKPTCLRVTGSGRTAIHLAVTHGEGNDPIRKGHPSMGNTSAVDRISDAVEVNAMILAPWGHSKTLVIRRGVSSGLGGAGGTSGSSSRSLWIVGPFGSTRPSAPRIPKWWR